MAAVLIYKKERLPTLVTVPNLIILLLVLLISYTSISTPP